MNLAPTTSLYKQIATAAALAGRSVGQVTCMQGTMTTSRISKGPLSTQKGSASTLLFYGTSKEGLDDLVKTGKLVSPPFPKSGGRALELARALGRGIYLTPHVDMALQNAGNSQGIPLVGCEVAMGKIQYGGDAMWGWNQEATGCNYFEGQAMYCVRDPNRVIPRFLIYLEDMTEQQKQELLEKILAEKGASNSGFNQTGKWADASP